MWKKLMLRQSDVGKIEITTYLSSNDDLKKEHHEEVKRFICKSTLCVLNIALRVKSRERMHGILGTCGGKDDVENHRIEKKSN